jgi:hypothetical protein
MQRNDKIGYSWQELQELFQTSQAIEVTSDSAEAYVSPFSCPDTVRNAGLPKKS